MNKKITIGYHFTFWIGLSICFVNLDYHQKLPFVRRVLNKLTDPLIYGVDQPITVIKRLKDLLQEKNKIYQKIEILQASQVQLQVQLNRYQSLVKENQSLKQLLHSTTAFQEHYVTLAQLSNIKQCATKSEYRINCGAKQGVKVGHIVIDAHGIIGRIIEVQPNTSRVLNINDRRNSTPVEILRNGLRGILKGRGTMEFCNVEYFSKTSDVRVDDELVTSGIGGQYLKGYPVASITSVENNPTQPYLKVSAAPKAALTTNQLLLVLEIQEKF